MFFSTTRILSGCPLNCEYKHISGSAILSRTVTACKPTKDFPVEFNVFGEQQRICLIESHKFKNILPYLQRRLIRAALRSCSLTWVRCLPKRTPINPKPLGSVLSSSCTLLHMWLDDQCQCSGLFIKPVSCVMTHSVHQRGTYFIVSSMLPDKDSCFSMFSVVVHEHIWHNSIIGKSIASLPSVWIANSIESHTHILCIWGRLSLGLSCTV